MGQITPEALKFLEEAKNHFNGQRMAATYTNGKFIALRWGLFENCMKIYELGEEVGLFTEQLERINSTIIDNKDKERLEKIEKIVGLILSEIPVSSKEGRSDYSYMVTADKMAALRQAFERQ